MDYSVSAKELWERLTRKSLLHQPFALLRFDLGQSVSSSLGLPSWVCDLTLKDFADPFKFDFYKAGGLGEDLKLSESSFSPQDGSLTLSGYDFGVIRSNPGFNPHRREGEMAEEFWLNSQIKSSPYGDENGQYQACWRTLIGNQYQD